MYLGSFLLCELLSDVTAKHSIAVESWLSVCLSVTLVNCGRMYLYLVWYQFAIMIKLIRFSEIQHLQSSTTGIPNSYGMWGGVLFLTETLHCLTLWNGARPTLLLIHLVPALHFPFLPKSTWRAIMQNLVSKYIFGVHHEFLNEDRTTLSPAKMQANN